MRRVFVAIVTACLLVLCIATQAAHAKGISICTPNGENCKPASEDNLKVAINEASQGSVIKLTDGVYSEHNIIIKKNVTIRGDTPRGTIIEGDSLSCWLTTRTVTDTQRIFEIVGGRVTMENLTIRNGCVAAEDGDAQGGGIWSAGDLTLTSVILQDNVAKMYRPDTPKPGATPGFAQGGAIYNTGIMRIDSSSILTNTAAADLNGAFGGGIYNNGTASVINSTIGGNRAQEDKGGLLYVGGGIFSSGTLLTAEYNSFVGNVATLAGGGLGAAGPVRLVSNLFHQNVSYAGIEDCITIAPNSPITERARYTQAPSCDTPRPHNVQLSGLTTDTFTPVYRPSTSLREQSGSMNVADCTISSVKVDQLGNPRGLGEKCDLGAVDAAMSFMPTLQAAPAKADLRVRSVTIDPPPGEITAGTKVMITVVVENVGDLATQRRFYIDMFINPSVAPPNRSGVTWTDLCRTEECVNDEGMIWLAPPTITEDGGAYSFRTDMDNDPTVVRISSKFDRYLPAGPVDIWVYADSYSKNRSENGVIDELTETNNQYHYPSFIVKPGRILPGAADQQPTGRPALPTFEP